MSRGYLPPADVTLKDWLTNFCSVLSLNCATVGVTPEEVTPLQEESDEFGTALVAYQEQQKRLNAASSNRKTKRSVVKDDIRAMVRRINHHPGMTDQLRSMLGLVPVVLLQAETPISALIPEVILAAAPGQVTVHWGPTPGNERINGKPHGVRGANIYRKKAGEASFHVVGYATKSPYYDQISGPGTDYVYVVRYRGTKQTDLSPESAESTVAARGALAA